MASEKQLWDNGFELIRVRQVIRDLERKGSLITVKERDDLKEARELYRRLLAIRRALVDQSQMRLW